MNHRIGSRGLRQVIPRSQSCSPTQFALAACVLARCMCVSLCFYRLIRLFFPFRLWKLVFFQALFSTSPLPLSQTSPEISSLESSTLGTIIPTHKLTLCSDVQVSFVPTFFSLCITRVLPILCVRHHDERVVMMMVSLCCSNITSMASSSVSQEDFDNDFELTSRRSRIRTARARVGPPRTGDVSSISFQSTCSTVVRHGLFTNLVVLGKLGVFGSWLCWR